MILFFGIIFLWGCSSTKELDAWPIVYYENNPEKQETRLDLLGPLYSYQNTPQIKSHAFRPLFVGEFPKDKEVTELMFCWPFIYYKKQPNDTKIWALPVYYYRDIQRPDFGERDFDWFFLPFAIFGGVDTAEGNYLYVTVWGNTKGLLGYDEITMTPFPFYVKARDGEYVTKGYMWPLFRFGEGGGKHFNFYCFMYSEYDKDGKFQRRSYLWPLIHYNKEDLDKKHPITEFMFFPFYGQSTSDVSDARMMLWPFFSYSTNEESGYKEYNCPWPFFKTLTSKEVEEFRIWPFYWKIDKKIGELGKEDDLILMWPFYWNLKSDYSSYEKESLYVLPFYWSHWRKSKEPNAQETGRTKIWPLLSYEKLEDGTIHYQGPSPLFFEDYLPNGFEKAWVPLFTLFDYKSGPQGKTTMSMLGPIYQYKEDQESLYHRVLIFSYKEVESSQEDIRRFSVLGGLIKYEWDQGESGLSFFYLPDLISWGDKQPNPKAQIHSQKIDNMINSQEIKPEPTHTMQH